MRNKVSIKSLTVIICILCAAALSYGMGRNKVCSSSSVSPRRLERKIHALINKEREKRGLRVLSWNVPLHDIARKFSKEMARRDFFSHTDMEGRNFSGRYEAAGFSCRIRTGNTFSLGAENISGDNLVGSISYEDGKISLICRTEDEIARSVVERWMSSKGHRRNILTSYFTREGVGVAVADDGKVYVTEDFC